MPKRGLVGAIAMAAIIGGLWIAGFGPSHEAAAPVTPSAPQLAAPQTAAPQIAPTFRPRLDKIEAALQAQQALTSRDRGRGSADQIAVPIRLPR